MGTGKLNIQIFSSPEMVSPGRRTIIPLELEEGRGDNTKRCLGGKVTDGQRRY